MLARVLHIGLPADGGKSSVQAKANELVDQAMAGGTWVIRTDGTVWEATPKNGKDFKLEEMQAIVDGYIEIVRAKDGRLIVLNEEGKLKHLPVNALATELYCSPDDVIVGDVLVCQPKEVK